MDFKGLRWYKCDFHLHTMRSLCYKERENETVDDWVGEVKKKGLHCIAITDHNDYRGIDEIKEKCLSDGVLAFPGVELSCDSTKVHLLIIFDITESGERVREFLNQVGMFSDSLGKSEVTCQGDIYSVCQIAHDMGALVVAGHIDEFNGLCEISHDNLERILCRKYIDAVQVVNEEIWRDYINAPNWEEICKALSLKYGKPISEDKAKSWNKSYVIALNSHLPMLEFSDNPSGEGESHHGLWGIGRAFSWLKMDKSPNLESIRQALLSSDMRLKTCVECKTQPDMSPEIWISGISANNTILNRSDEISMCFNPQLNTIIGGRGSGKSSIIRLIAGGLDSFDADDLSNIREEQEYFYQEQKKDKHGY